MNIPEGVRRAVGQALSARGLGNHIRTAVPEVGGCINHGARIETDTGADLFLKWNPSSPAQMFEAEADGLAALQSASSLRVPDVVAWGDGAATAAWLLMEYLPAGRASSDAERALGIGLSEMHARPAPGSFGWGRHNWIGSLGQDNTESELWGDFWRTSRIEPQLLLARRNGLMREGALDVLLDVIPRALADVHQPQLLHGDLWGGNWYASESGEPVLIDPAVYRGHGEVDLAMSELFGGFGPAFYDAYWDSAPPHAYTAYRRDLYQLYYLLVHVNLFGSGYAAGALRAAHRVLSEVG